MGYVSTLMRIQLAFEKAGIRFLDNEPGGRDRGAAQRAVKGTKRRLRGDPAECHWRLLSGFLGAIGVYNNGDSKAHHRRGNPVFHAPG